MQVLETCVNHCGEKFHNEVAKFRFLNELIKVLSPKVSAVVWALLAVLHLAQPPNSCPFLCTEAGLLLDRPCACLRCVRELREEALDGKAPFSMVSDDLADPCPPLLASLNDSPFRSGLLVPPEGLSWLSVIMCSERLPV